MASVSTNEGSHLAGVKSISASVYSFALKVALGAVPRSKRAAVVALRNEVGDSTVTKDARFWTGHAVAIFRPESALQVLGILAALSGSAAVAATALCIALMLTGILLITVMVLLSAVVSCSCVVGSVLFICSATFAVASASVASGAATGTAFFVVIRQFLCYMRVCERTRALVGWPCHCPTDTVASHTDDVAATPVERSVQRPAVQGVLSDVPVSDARDPKTPSGNAGAEIAGDVTPRLYHDRQAAVSFGSPDALHSLRGPRAAALELGTSAGGAQRRRTGTHAGGVPARGNQAAARAQRPRRYPTPVGTADKNSDASHASVAHAQASEMPRSRRAGHSPDSSTTTMYDDALDPSELPAMSASPTQSAASRASAMSRDDGGGRAPSKVVGPPVDTGAGGPTESRGNVLAMMEELFMGVSE